MPLLVHFSPGPAHRRLPRPGGLGRLRGRREAHLQVLRRRRLARRAPAPRRPSQPRPARRGGAACAVLRQHRLQRAQCGRRLRRRRRDATRKRRRRRRDAARLGQSGDVRGAAAGAAAPGARSQCLGGPDAGAAGRRRGAEAGGQEGARGCPRRAPMTAPRAANVHVPRQRAGPVLTGVRLKANTALSSRDSSTGMPACIVANPCRRGQIYLT